MVSVMIVDDQQLVRGGLAMLIGSQPDLEVVAEAGDGAAALDSFRACQDAGRVPDIVLMDVRMPVMDGLEAAQKILAQGYQSKVIMLTTFDVDEYVFAAVRLGASGFLLKDAPPEELLSAIRTVYRGDAVIAPSATRRLLEQMVPKLTPVQAQSEHAEKIATLTNREREVLLLMAQGKNNGEICAELFLSEATVKTHVSHVLAKLQARDRVQAVVIAYEAHLV